MAAPPAAAPASAEKTGGLRCVINGARRCSARDGAAGCTCCFENQFDLPSVLFIYCFQRRCASTNSVVDRAFNPNGHNLGWAVVG